MGQYGLCFQYTTPYKKVSKYFYFQIIAGTINVVNFANKSVIQIRRVSSIYVEGVTLVLPSRLFMFNEYWRILALS
jgi:hypothetical protein